MIITRKQARMLLFAAYHYNERRNSQRPHATNIQAMEDLESFIGGSTGPICEVNNNHLPWCESWLADMDAYDNSRPIWWGLYFAVQDALNDPSYR